MAKKSSYIEKVRLVQFGAVKLAKNAPKSRRRLGADEALASIKL